MRKKKLIIDANLLLLIVIGRVQNGIHIKSSNRLDKYNIDDYDKVLEIMARHDELYITPYIAAEISNLIDLTGAALIEAREVIRALSLVIKQIDVSIQEDCESDAFLHFGITDSSLIGLAQSYYILTDDHRMLKPLFAAGPYNIIPYSLNA